MRSRAGGQPQRVLLNIRNVQVQGDANLAQVALARGGSSGFLGPRQRGQKHGRQNRNDGDDYQQLDEGKRGSAGLDQLPGHEKLSLSLRFEFVKYYFQAPRLKRLLPTLVIS